MQPPLDHAAAARRESKLLIGVAAGLGCLILACLVLLGAAALLAYVWTMQGQLGPGGSSLAPAGAVLLSHFG